MPHAKYRPHDLPLAIDAVNPLRSYWKLVVLIPLSWLLGFDFVFPFFLLIYGGLRFQKFGNFEVLVASLGVWLLVSVMMSDSTDTGRILSSIYSALLLIALATVHANFRGIFQRSSMEQLQEFIGRVYKPLFYMCVIFALFGLFLGFGLGIYSLQFKTLLGLISPVELPGIADRSMIAEIIRPDWGFGSFPMPRPLIFSPWYTAGAMITACAGLFTLAYVSQQRNGSYKELLVELFLVLTIFLTLSRTTLLMYLIGFVLASFLLRDGKRIIFILTVALFGGAYAWLKIDFAELLAFRSYSNESRLTAYLLGIQLAVQESVLFGYGVKPRIEGLSIPIGSHSSWISFFVRGGTVGVGLFFCWMYVIPILNLLRKLPKISKLSYGARMMAAGPLRFLLLAFGWVFLQEIDTAALAVTLLFISMALANAIFEKLLEPSGKDTGRERI